MPSEQVTPGSVRPAGFTSTDLVLLLMAFIWGLNISVVKYGTSVMPALPYNTMRVALAAVTLMVLGGLVREAWPGRRQVMQLLALGFLGNGIYQVLFVEGVARTRAGNAALVLAATPALIALFGWLRGVERPTTRRILGITLSLGGVILVVGTGAMTATRATLTGDALMLCGTICWALFTVLLKPYMQNVHSVQLAGLTMLGGVFPLLLFSIPQFGDVAWGAIPALAWTSLIFSGLGALVLAYLLWYHGVKVLGPTRTAMYGNLQPAIALIFAWVLLGEVPTLVQGIGASGIISGLLLART